MKIKQIRYAADNLGYLVYSEKIGIAIDAGAVDETLRFAKNNRIKIQYVTNTHSHYDHTPGNEGLLNATKATFVDCEKINSDVDIALGDETLHAFPTPGHTGDSITFAADDFMVTGDTLLTVPLVIVFQEI